MFLGMVDKRPWSMGIVGCTHELLRSLVGYSGVVPQREGKDRESDLP